MHLNERFSSSPAEAREHPRHEIGLPGTIFVPGGDLTIACQVINLSGGGAGLLCDDPPPLDTQIVLYIDGFGRMEGVTTRQAAGELGLRFVCREPKRERLLADILRFVAHGVTAPTRLRKHYRRPLSVEGCFARSNGEKVRCEILDMSLQGLSLKTNVRPPVGETINLGRTLGRVVRHHGDGISVEFLAAQDPIHGD